MNISRLIYFLVYAALSSHAVPPNNVVTNRTKPPLLRCFVGTSGWTAVACLVFFGRLGTSFPFCGRSSSRPANPGESFCPTIAGWKTSRVYSRGGQGCSGGFMRFPRRSEPLLGGRFDFGDWTLSFLCPISGFKWSDLWMTNKHIHFHQQSSSSFICWAGSLKPAAASSHLP